MVFGKNFFPPKYTYILLLLFSFLIFTPNLTFAANIDAILDEVTGGAGTSTFSVKDSASTEIFHVDSNGNIVTKGCFRY